MRQGLFVADICFVEPEGAPRSFSPPIARTGNPPDRPGYNFDLCPPEAVLTRMSVRDGRVVLPDGMSYRLLVLPDSQTMTPALLGKIAELVEAGATVLGAPPQKSPSLSGYPACDGEVKRLAARLWGNCDGKAVQAEAVRQGQGALRASRRRKRWPRPACRRTSIAMRHCGEKSATSTAACRTASTCILSPTVETRRSKASVRSASPANSQNSGGPRRDEPNRPPPSSPRAK